MKDSDLRVRGLDPSRVRRWFKAHHGITFQGYQRLLRLGEALGRLRLGDGLAQVAYDFGYESLSGFRDAFQKLFNETPGTRNGHNIVTVNRILTPLGPMLAGVSEQGICLLEFVDRRMIETQINRLRRSLKCTFVPGDHKLLTQLSNELAEYFNGERKAFSVPLDLPGSQFTRRVWEALRKIPYGETRSYQDQANMIGMPAAVRAVARANGDNRVAIVIPCHRVIGADGTMKGYGGGIWRKRLLLDLEQKKGDGVRKSGSGWTEAGGRKQDAGT
jgi:AraC family transcriptional regulator of adaptative response/methylated-DNA-[protein]-cysteine methyltransferase